MSQPEILEGRTAYVNGDFLPIAEARVSVLDRGFLYGDGLYETLNVANGRTFRLEAHLDRLFQSAAVLKITVPLSRDVLRDAIFATVERNALADAYVRILLSRGESHPIIDTRAAVRPATLVILVHSRQQPPEVASYFTGAGLNARIVSLRKIAPTALEPRVKSLNYLNSVLARAEAIEAGADEAIMLDADGFVAEGAGSNIFALHGATLVTPPVTSILVGVTRGVTIELAPAAGLAVVERNVTSYDLYTASEVFLTSTYGGLTPIAKIDGRRIGDICPGEVTLQLKAAYQALLESDGDALPGTQAGGGALRRA